MAARDLTWFSDLLVAADPGRQRLRTALRATLTVMLGALLLPKFATFLGAPAGLGLAGVAIGMSASFVAQDATVREQRVTQVLMVFPAIVCIALGTLVADNRWLVSGLFLVVIFTSVSARRFGPRATALGMIGFMSYFFAVFFKVPPKVLPALLAIVTAGVVLAGLVRFVVVPDHPEKQLRNAIEAFRRRVCVMLVTLAEAAVSKNRRRVRPEIQRLNEAAIGLEDRLDAFALEPVRLQVLELELAAENVTAHSRVDPRPELAGELLALRDAVRNPEEFRDVAPFNEPQRRLAHAAAALRLPDVLTSVHHAPTAAPPLVSDDLHPMTRQALQATVASALAILGGQLVSPERWFWAVIAAFMVFNRVTTLGDTLVRAWHRVLGTVAGVLAGVLLADLVRGHLAIELFVLFSCVFLAFYFLQVAYGWMVFFITAVLALMYVLLGRFSPGLMWLRVEETLVGASVGALAAIFVLPTPTYPRIRTALHDVLRSLTDLLDRAIVHREDVAVRIRLARALDRRVVVLREAATPVTGWGARLAPETARLVHATLGLTFYARQLAAGDALDQHPESREAAQEAGRRLVAETEGISRALLDGERPPAPAPVAAAPLPWLPRMHELLGEIADGVGALATRRP